MTVLLDIHQFCAKGFYEARTTSRCLSLPFHYLSSFAAWMGIRRLVIFARPFGLCVETTSAHLLLWCICISKTLLIPLFKFLLDFDHDVAYTWHWLSVGCLGPICECDEFVQWTWLLCLPLCADGKNQPVWMQMGGRHQWVPRVGILGLPEKGCVQ